MFETDQLKLFHNSILTLSSVRVCNAYSRRNPGGWCDAIRITAIWIWNYSIFFANSLILHTIKYWVCSQSQIHFPFCRISTDFIKNTNDERLGHPTLLLRTWESFHNSKIYSSHFQLTRVFSLLPPLQSLLKQMILFILGYTMFIYFSQFLFISWIYVSKLDSGTRVLFFSGSRCNEFLQENEVMSSKYCVVQMKKEQKIIE